MVKGELRNIKEVKVDEQATSPNLNDFLFDVSSEQVEISPDFNWNTLVDAGGIIAEGSSSSQGS